MKNSKTKSKNVVTGKSNAQTESLKYQLDWLKIEAGLIDRAIARFDEITQTTKNWAIVTWAGSIALALGNTDLRKYIMITAILPFLFGYIDACWRHLQKRSIFRQFKISEFLNGSRLVESFIKNKLVKFTVLDPVGRQYKSTHEYKLATRIRHVIKFHEISFFYGGLALISLALGLYFLLTT